jgi:hypothetical protein
MIFIETFKNPGNKFLIRKYRVYIINFIFNILEEEYKMSFGVNVGGYSVTYFLFIVEIL